MNKLKYLYYFKFYCITLFLSLSSSTYADPVADGNKGIEEFAKGNLIAAMKLLKTSANQGYAPAQTTLGYILDQSEENNQAFHWFQQAALQGHAAGQFGLGNMYAKGEGTEKDIIKAGDWIKKSALQKHMPAMRAYAYALEFGELGLTQDKNAAGQWYLKTANAGDDVAMRRLSLAYRNGELGFTQDLQQAAIWELKYNKPEIKSGTQH